MADSRGSVFVTRSSPSILLEGVQEAVSVLSASRLASTADATTDRTSLIHSNTPAAARRTKTSEKPRKGIRSFLRRDSGSSIRETAGGSELFINELHKKPLKEMKFDLLKAQIENSNAAWLASFVQCNGGGLLLAHLTEENYDDEVKDKFIPCLRCFHSLVQRTEEANLGILIDANNFLNLIHILEWTTDLFLLSSTCMTLLDITNSPYGHLHLIDALARAQKKYQRKYVTHPFLCALRLTSTSKSQSKGLRICSEVVLTLTNAFIMGFTESEERFLCANELLAQGILPLILNLRAFGNLQGQLDLFEQTLTHDHHQMASKLGMKKLKLSSGSSNIFNVRLLNTPEQPTVRQSVQAEQTIQELLEILVLKQEYQGFETLKTEQYGFFVPGDQTQPNFIFVIDKVQLTPSLTAGDYGLGNDMQVDLQLLPWNLRVTDTEHDNEVLSVSANPSQTVDAVINGLTDPQFDVPACEVTARSKIHEYRTELEYGLYAPELETWLASESLLASYAELLTNTQSTLLLAVKLPPLVIKFKEQAFNVDVPSTAITVSQVFLTAAAKSNIPEEHQARYALFLDDGLSRAEDEPARGLLDGDQVISDILKEKNLECLTLSLALRPYPLQVQISEDSIRDPEHPTSYQVSVLLNHSVSEGLDVICKVTGHQADEHQLHTQAGEKLVDSKTFEAQGITEDSEVVLCQRTPDEEEVDEVNIWDEECSSDTFRTEIENGTELVVAATLNQLVRKATDEDKYDSNFLDTFLITYRSFTTPKILLQKLMQRYAVPASVPEQTKQVVQMRVLVVMKRWVAIFNDDEETALLDKINAWITNETAEGNPIIGGLKSVITKKRDASDQQFYFKSKPPIPRVPKEKTLGSLSMDDVDPLEMARQLTIVEFEIFSRIRPVEFFGQAWSRPKMQYLCPNLMNIISHFNYISCAVASVIVKEPKVRHRAKIYEKFVSLAEHLRSMNSFNLLVAVVSGLNNSGVGRLKWTKARVSSRALEMLDELETLTSMQQSYKNYRLTIAAAEPPLIPYLGIYLQDFVFIEDGNPDYVDDLINFSKRILVRKILAQIATFQQEAYNFVRVPILRAYLENLPQLGDDAIYKLSLGREPRNAKQRSEIE